MEQNLSRMQLLEDCGLSRNDARVYLTLLKQGAGTPTAISRHSGLFRANVYGCLRRLQSRSLVSEVHEDNKRMFQAAEPAALLTALDEKKVRLQSVLPQLQLDHDLAQKKVVEVFHGPRALRNLFHHYVSSKSDIYAFGIPRGTVYIIGVEFQNTVVHKQRAKQKQWMYHIYNSDAGERIEFLNTLPYTKAAHLPKEFDCPVMTVVCGDEVSITSFNGKEVFITVIRNIDMAAGYRKYFDVLWERTQN
jgi:hypothetical protein